MTRALATGEMAGADEADLPSLLAPVRERWRLMGVVFAACAVMGYAGSFLVKPVFNSTTTFLPPQQQQSSAASALASLGSLAGLAGGLSGIKSPAEQYVSLMQSVTVSDHIIDRFKLMAVYDTEFRQDARKTLSQTVQITVGKKDGLISVSVDDHDPKRAAAMANQYVDELRHLTSVLAVSEAQQRRVFFESQMQAAKTRLAAAQTALQESGFTAASLKAEPKATADTYAKLRAELTSTEIRLQALRTRLAEGAPEIRQLAATAAALRERVSEQEHSENSDPDASVSANYVGKYREFKYQETVFDLMAKQYELARIDESREGALIQVIDVASPGEKKVRPHRSIYTALAALLGTAAFGFYLVVRRRLRPADLAGDAT